MAGKEDHLKFKNEVNESHKKSVSKPQNYNNLKLKIIDKYGVSPEEADKVLLKIIESKDNDDILFNRKKSSIPRSFSDNSIDGRRKNVANEISNDLITPQNLNNYKKKINYNLTEENINNNSSNYFNGIKNISNQVSKKEVFNEDTTSLNGNDNSELKSHDVSDVDSILTDIIPDYNQQVSIEMEHVDLTFEVQTEIVDTLKESLIRKIKRDNPNKIKIHALNDISFKIFKGEKVGIIGYNGAGKSTLLNVISGIYSPDCGTVKTFGNISPLLALGAGFDINYSGRQNILLNGAILGFEKEFLQSKIDEIIEFSELGEFIDVPIKNYSSGMIAKLGFSIATSVNPDILIIDEILGVGDVNFQKKSSDKIQSLMDEGTTVLLVSHSIPAIRELCDKAIWIDNGKLREIGEVNKVCNHYLKDAEKATNEQLANIQFR